MGISQNNVSKSLKCEFISIDRFKSHGFDVKISLKFTKFSFEIFLLKPVFFVWT